MRIVRCLNTSCICLLHAIYTSLCITKRRYPFNVSFLSTGPSTLIKTLTLAANILLFTPGPYQGPNAASTAQPTTSSSLRTSSAQPSVRKPQHLGAKSACALGVWQENVWTSFEMPVKHLALGQGCWGLAVDGWHVSQKMCWLARDPCNLV